MFGSELAFSPEVVLAMWAAGVAGSGAAVAYWRIVGPGFLWLTVATVVLLGGGAWYFDQGVLAAVAVLGGRGRRARGRESLGGHHQPWARHPCCSWSGASVVGLPVPAITGSRRAGWDNRARCCSGTGSW